MLEDAVRQKRCLAGSLEPWQVLRLKSLVPFFLSIIYYFWGINFIFAIMIWLMMCTSYQMLSPSDLEVIGQCTN